MRHLNRHQIADRGMETEAHVLEVIRALLDAGQTRLSINDITHAFLERFGDQYERKMTAKWLGGVVRRKLLLRTEKSHGVYVILLSEEPALARLFERYGITATQTKTQQQARTTESNV